MIEYICPECHKDMEQHFDFVKCVNCKILYFKITGNFYLKEFDKKNFFYCGTFEECCRAYKMKAFS